MLECENQSVLFVHNTNMYAKHILKLWFIHWDVELIHLMLNMHTYKDAIIKKIYEAFVDQMFPHLFKVDIMFYGLLTSCSNNLAKLKT
jgi:hypothetical protein